MMLRGLWCSGKCLLVFRSQQGMGIGVREERPKTGGEEGGESNGED